MTTTETTEAPERAETAVLLAELRAVSGFDVLAVRRIAADPGVRNVRPNHPGYRPATPRQWGLTFTVPADHPIRGNPWWAETIGLSVTSGAIRNPRSLNDLVLRFAVDRPERSRTAEDGHAIVRLLHKIADLTEGKIDHAR